MVKLIGTMDRYTPEFISLFDHFSTSLSLWRKKFVHLMILFSLEIKFPHLLVHLKVLVGSTAFVGRMTVASKHCVFVCFALLYLVHVVIVWPMSRDLYLLNRSYTPDSFRRQSTETIKTTHWFFQKTINRYIKTSHLHFTRTLNVSQVLFFVLGEFSHYGNSKKIN